MTWEIRKAISQVYSNISYRVTHTQPIDEIVYTDSKEHGK